MEHEKIKFLRPILFGIVGTDRRRGSATSPVSAEQKVSSRVGRSRKAGEGRLRSRSQFILLF